MQFYRVEMRCNPESFPQAWVNAETEAQAMLEGAKLMGLDTDPLTQTYTASLVAIETQTPQHKETTMQVRSSNMSVASRTMKHNPMIIACDRNWDEVYRAPLDQIVGMAYGPRQDYESGYRGMKYNQCINDASRGADGRSIHGWTVVA